MQCQAILSRLTVPAAILLATLIAPGCSAEDAVAKTTFAAQEAAANTSDDLASTMPSAFPTAAPGQTGPFATVTERNVGPDGAFTLIRPRDLASSSRMHPLITWGNGTSASPSMYASLLNRLASHGFVVIASNSPNTGSANEMIQGIDWVLAQNQTPGSAMSGKIDPERIGATGHSQGGFGTCVATRDLRIKTIVPLQGFRAPSAKWRGSILAVAGGQDTIVAASGVQSGFGRVTSGPAMYAELKSATHLNWMSGSGGAGAEINEAVTAWMRAHLMDDAALRPYFYGSSCRYCTSSAWTVRHKDME